MGVKRDMVIAYREFILATIVKVKKKYKCDLSPEDLFQEGVIGLLHAFDEARDAANFSSYARKKICEAIKGAAKAESDNTKFHEELRKEFFAYQKARTQLYRKLHRPPTIEEIYEVLRISRKRLERLEILYEVALKYDEE